MSRSAWLAPLAGFLLASCASMPVPATRSPENPAHPEAPESVTPPARPGLLDETPESEGTAPAAQPQSTEGHSADGAPGPGAEQAYAYTCPMHPEVSSDKPGTCPVCGMSLVATEKPRDYPR